ncbi:MAG: hypothetical protein FWG64_08440 [Firmicutes bacterium]|nr:hypothetical protein [Bacillota bacterium]
MENKNILYVFDPETVYPGKWIITTEKGGDPTRRNSWLGCVYEVYDTEEEAQAVKAELELAKIYGRVLLIKGVTGEFCVGGLYGEYE